MNPSKYVLVAEAAKILGVTTHTVINRIKRGRIKATRFGRQWFILRNSLGKNNG